MKFTKMMELLGQFTKNSSTFHFLSLFFFFSGAGSQCPKICLLYIFPLIRFEWKEETSPLNIKLLTLLLLIELESFEHKRHSQATDLYLKASMLY